MKQVIALFSVILMTGCVNVKEQLADVHPMEYVAQAGILIDGIQTLQIAEHPECREENNFITRKIIGTNPKKNNVYKWIVGSMVTHFYLFKWIDKKFKKNNTNLFLRGTATAGRYITIKQNYDNGIRFGGLEKKEAERCERERMRQDEILSVGWKF